MCKDTSRIGFDQHFYQIIDAVMLYILQQNNWAQQRSVDVTPKSWIREIPKESPFISGLGIIYMELQSFAQKQFRNQLHIHVTNPCIFVSLPYICFILHGTCKIYMVYIYMQHTQIHHGISFFFQPLDPSQKPEPSSSGQPGHTICLSGGPEIKLLGNI